MKYSLYDLCMYVYPAFYFGICYVCYAFASGLLLVCGVGFVFIHFFFLVDGGPSWFKYWQSEFSI